MVRCLLYCTYTKALKSFFIIIPNISQLFTVILILICYQTLFMNLNYRTTSHTYSHHLSVYAIIKSLFYLNFIFFYFSN